MLTTRKGLWNVARQMHRADVDVQVLLCMRGLPYIRPNRIVVRADPSQSIPGSRRNLHEFSRRKGPIGSTWSVIPAPIKAFGWVALTAAGVVFISLPILIIAGPPIVIGLWLYSRRMRKIANEIYRQRWNNMGSYHLAFVDDTPTDGYGQQRRMGEPERIAKERVMKAMDNNEQNMASQLGVRAHNGIYPRLTFTDVEMMQRDFKASSQGMQERMEIRSLGLIDQETRRRIADVTIVVHSNSSDQTHKRMRIEVTGAGYNAPNFILDGTPQNEDVVIEIKRR
jgi:hypothetical protein